MPQIENLDDENLADIDETLVERLVGLTEMFPESVRSGTIATARGVVSGAKWLYSVSGKTVWILSTSFVILALPVIFEVERVQTEEAQLQQQRQILLGPGSAGGGMGLPPGYLPPQQQRN
ncbi:Mitochondrial import receptor subunit TOM22-like protein [Acropora cervicornis]|uniref:Mitochondrial import receptor subunit TOM22 homolog n=1 Tax=Acropora cervicornis TaxID=6130 RepID=A0AAD9QQI9_ACRCE|nr:mitochondrial import receptor subunit TOM22 homolog [Acropora millepora]KAK2565485.1 Mitochondrial import receptor subunit TOM22-like protein [Acropora cervicornis]